MSDTNQTILPKEFCFRCDKVTPSRRVEHGSWTEWLCQVCNWQVDCDWDESLDDEDYAEPIGSCDNCGTNIYRYDDDGTELCDQCQWWADQ